jgi:hypothetical protein
MTASAARQSASVPAIARSGCSAIATAAAMMLIVDGTLRVRENMISITGIRIRLG